MKKSGLCMMVLGVVAINSMVRGAYYDQPLTATAGTTALYHFDGNLTNATSGAALVSNGGDYSFQGNNPKGNSAFGNALYFDPTNNASATFTAGDSGLVAGQNVQIDLWAFPELDKFTSTDRVLVAQDGAVSICIMPSSGDHANQVRVLLGTTEKWWDWDSAVYSTTTMADRTWNHITVQYVDGQVKLLINGVVEDTADWSGTIAGVRENRNLTLGAWFQGDSHNYAGMIDDLRISSVPEPATIALLIVGLLGFTRRQKA